jgi:mercuric ion transport protein
MSKESAASTVGLMAAFAASLCCITPVIALMAGVSGAASSLAWFEPFRPYLIGAALLALAFAWYQSLRASKVIQCGPEGTCVVPKRSFLPSRSFLIVITAATVLIATFPLYTKAFYPTPNTAITAAVKRTNVRAATFTIKGMTCAGCEEHVNSELSKVNGVVTSVTSYEKRNTLVHYDKTKVTIQQLQQVIAKTGYKVINTELEINGSTN